MNVKELSPIIIATLKNKPYDRIVEKHEGPETWDWQVPRSEERIQKLKEMYQGTHYDFSTDNHAEFLKIGGVVMRRLRDSQLSKKQAYPAKNYQD